MTELDNKHEVHTSSSYDQLISMLFHAVESTQEQLNKLRLNLDALELEVSKLQKEKEEDIDLYLDLEEVDPAYALALELEKRVSELETKVAKTQEVVSPDVPQGTTSCGTPSPDLGFYPVPLDADMGVV